jgi:hypothetical protein
MRAARWRPSKARETKRMRPARSSDSFPGLEMAYSRRYRFAVTYTEGVRHKSTVSKSPQGTSNCILTTSKRLSRCLCPRREQKRKSATDCPDKFFCFVRRDLRKKYQRMLSGAFAQPFRGRGDGGI